MVEAERMAGVESCTTRCPARCRTLAAWAVRSLGPVAAKLAPLSTKTTALSTLGSQASTRGTIERDMA